MDIDSHGKIDVVYYDDEGGTSFKPFYRVLEFPQTGDPIFNSPIDISIGISTSNIFTRPGDYFTIRVDSNDIPHVVWSDGRNNEMDIYYAHGVISSETTTITTATTTKTISLGISIFTLLIFILLHKFKKKKRK